jgi:hypothetical protein
VCDIQHKEPPKRRDRKSDREDCHDPTIPYLHPHLTQTIHLRSAACGQHSTALFFFGLQAASQQKKIWIPFITRRCKGTIRHGVGIVSRQGAGRSGGSNPGEGTRFFCSTYRLDRVWGPPNSLFKEHRVSIQERKWPGRDVEHSLPSSAEVKNEKIKPLFPPYAFMV